MVNTVKSLYASIILIILVIVVLGGCNAREEKPSVPAPATQKAAENRPSRPPTVSASVPVALPSDIIIEVNDAKFTRSQLDAELNGKLISTTNEIPAKNRQEARAGMRRQLINDFIARALLAGEVKRLQIKVSEREMAEAMEQLKSSLPPGITFEELIKRNGTSEEKMRSEISLGIKINKMVMAQLAGNDKPTEKEIYKFYDENKDKFKTGEAVRVRHVLVAVDKDKKDAKERAEKKDKAEQLRKQLLGGADFAELAAKDSDCPSKQAGGDLGLLYRGQTVKAFEDAAFAQQPKVIGPVVETEFGYHIIQVLEHRPAQQVALDKKIREEIASFIGQQKKQDAFAGIMKRLKAKATIVVHDEKE